MFVTVSRIWIMMGFDGNALAYESFGICQSVTLAEWSYLRHVDDTRGKGVDDFVVDGGFHRLSTGVRQPVDEQGYGDSIAA